MVGHAMTRGAANAKDAAHAVYEAMTAGEMDHAVSLANTLWRSRRCLQRPAPPKMAR